MSDDPDHSLCVNCGASNRDITRNFDPNNRGSTSWQGGNMDHTGYWANRRPGLCTTCYLTIASSRYGTSDEQKAALKRMIEEAAFFTKPIHMPFVPAATMHRNRYELVGIPQGVDRHVLQAFVRGSFMRAVLQQYDEATQRAVVEVDTARELGGVRLVYQGAACIEMVPCG